MVRHTLHFERTTNDMTTVQLTKKFVAWLDSQGKRNETYEQILKRLLK